MATGRAWDEVRRALGRLVGRVSTHSLSEARSGIAATVYRPDAIQFAAPPPGARQGEWRPSAQVLRLPPPDASPGGGGGDPSAVVTVIGADGALRQDTAIITEAPCRFVQPSVHLWASEHGTAGAASVQGGAVRLDAATSPRTEVTFQAVVACPVDVAVSRPTTDRGVGWRITPRGVSSGLAPILRVPITCRRQPTRTDAPERRLLAISADVPEADVALIGVFPHVPLGAVERLAVTPDGDALQVWVRPGATGRGAGTVTVVLGRQRSTGRMLQAVSRGRARE